MVAFHKFSIDTDRMTERNPYSLLLHDSFMGEFINDDRTPATFRSIDSARWGALALAEELYEEQRSFGSPDEEGELLPYTIYIVGPDGSLLRDSAL